jgi:hypothetical protein
MAVTELFGLGAFAELVEWFMQRVLFIWGSGFLLGVIISAGVALSRRNRQPRRLSVARTTALGALGGLVVSMLLIVEWKASTFSNLWGAVLSYAVPLTSFGSLIGFGIGRIARAPARLSDAQRDEFRRESITRWSVGLSVAFLADGLFMAWALNEGGYAPLGYGKISFLPVFMPALLTSLVMLGSYARGVRRNSWSVRRSEWVFVLMLSLALAAKVVVFVRGDRG